MTKSLFDQKRRDFLKSLFLTTPLFALNPTAYAKTSNNFKRKKLKGAIIGAGYITNKLHLQSLYSNKSVSIKYICDVDRDQILKTQDHITKKYGQHNIKFLSNYDEILHDKEVDFVLIALPHHWLTRAALDFMKAKKHIYLEKPCFLTLEEGLLLKEAYSKSSILMQVGTQNRANRSHQAIVREYQSGKLGTAKSALLITHQKKTDRIIPRKTELNQPKNIDLERWFGPSFNNEIKREFFHEDWARFWNYSHGLGDRSVHRLDMLNWIMDFKSPSDSVISYAGLCPSKEGDIGETPNFSYAIHKHKNFEYINEYKILEEEPILGIRRGIIVETDKGHIVMNNLSKATLLDQNGKLIKVFGPKKTLHNHVSHFNNFIESIFKDSRENLFADYLNFYPSSVNSILENHSYLKGKDININNFKAAKDSLAKFDSKYLKKLKDFSTKEFKFIQGSKLENIDIEKMVTKSDIPNYPIKKKYPDHYKL